MSECRTIDINRPLEQWELEKKCSELATLEGELAQCELELTTLRSELHVFEARYLRLVGIHYTELDELEAQIAEAQTHLWPKDDRLQEQASQARTQAQESARSVGDRTEPGQPDKFQPSEHLKKVYRDLAKRIHPGLTTDEQERARRQRLMAETNDAYAAGDEPRLQAIWHEWKTSPEAIKGEGIGVELVRVIRKIAQGQERLRVIAAEMTAWRASDLYQLQVKVAVAEDEGRSPLVEMAHSVEEKIAAARNRLAKITGKRTDI